MKKKLLGYYDYTVILTYFGMLSAMTGIFLSMNSGYFGALICLMVAGLCDMFDGAVASTKERTRPEKNFGIQIDSMSDLISFGVLPGVFVYCFMGRTPFSAAISALFVLCALIRLSYFNVLEEERQQQTDEGRKEYLGVPVTTVALLLPLVFLFYVAIAQLRSLFPLALAVLALCFILPLNVKKPRKSGKVVMAAVGVAELAGLLVLMGA